MSPSQVLSTLALAASLSAQIVATFPSDHATVANGQGGQTWFPYSYGVSRMMAVYESWDLNIPAGRQITRIGFRADGTTLSYGKSLQLEVRMGQTERTAADMVNTFDTNYFLGQSTTVFGPALYTLPDLNNVLNPNPDGGLVWLTLTTPYTFNPNRNLAVEWRVYANSNGGASFSYYLDSADFISPITTGPNGCPHSGGQTPQLLSRRTRVGSTWYNDLSQGPANQIAVLFINVNTPLQPQFPLTPFFAGISPTCMGQVTLLNLFSMSATTGSSGFRTFSVPVPNDRNFNNVILSSQAMCFDFFAPGGVVVSNGDQIELGIDPAMSVLWHQGSATNPTGNIYRNYGVVTLFDHN
jgi:hypothetical protein